jgi:cyclophilin family peptidyl-prolyl cis-trans isomerase
MLAVAPMILALAQVPSPAQPTLAPLLAASPEPSPAAPSGPIVVIETSLGRIRLVLDKEKAPISVDNFLKYVRSGHYDGTIFHRVIPGFMIQGGGYDPDLSERPLRPPIKNEAKNGLRNLRGSVAMARTNEPNSATAQFFINAKDNHALDFGIRGAGYAVFGQVVEGMDVVDKILAVPTTLKGVHQNAPVTPVIIKRAREAVAGTRPRTPSPKPVASPGR